MTHYFADNYGESQAHRAGLGNDGPEIDDFCAIDGHEKCDGELGACLCKCHEMQEAQKELTAQTFAWFENEVETQRRRK